MLVACGDNSGFMLGDDHYEMDFVSLLNGDVLTRSPPSGSGTYCFFRIQSGGGSGTDLTLLTDLYNRHGDSIAHNERSAPAVNADTPIELPPQLPQGQYKLVLTLKRGEQRLASADRSFFLVDHPVTIQGILSYPIVIFPSRTALLIADIDPTPGLDPYLKWTQGAKKLASGRLNDGYDQILWESPGEDGVYSVEVEVFPFPPDAGAEYPFLSPVKAAAELYISAKDQAPVAARPASLSYNLFDIYIKALRERERVGRGSLEKEAAAEAPQLRQPVPVILGDAIGMKFDGRSGFSCPELIFPVHSRSIDAFTLTLGVKFEGEEAGRNLLSSRTGDGSLEMKLFFSDSGELMLGILTKTSEYLFPSGIDSPPKGARLLIEASVKPVEGRLRVSWKMNGREVSEAEKTVTIEAGEVRGTTVVGGENGVRCSIDTLDVELQ
ncbi:MAG: hypothetical protein JXD23_12090 [Spirochaetales bacterium]|nr:hypothetical protein [Spirochaetales bacterium]